MREHDKARPVSGEIMSDDRDIPRKSANRDFTDAEFEIVDGAAVRPRPPGSAEPSVSGMDFLKPGPSPTPAKRPRRQGGPAFWISGMVIIFGAFWVSGGHALVRQLPIAQPVAAANPLRIAEVASRVENHAGGAVLFVDGKVENRGADTLPRPPLVILVTEPDGATTRYFLGTNDTVLQPGESYSFSSRLEAPTNGVESVSVTFGEGSV